jgi:hypothetical protein
VLYGLHRHRDSAVNRVAGRLEMQDSMGPTDITVADWLEVIRAEDHEIPNLHPLVPPLEDPWAPDLRMVEAVVTLAEVEYLKRARRNAYMPAN